MGYAGDEDIKGAAGYENGHVYIGVDIPKYATSVKFTVDTSGIKNVCDFIANTSVQLEVGSRRKNEGEVIQVNGSEVTVI